jgi:hypothetical protein
MAGWPSPAERRALDSFPELSGEAATNAWRCPTRTCGRNPDVVARGVVNRLEVPEVHGCLDPLRDTLDNAAYVYVGYFT